MLKWDLSLLNGYINNHCFGSYALWLLHLTYPGSRTPLHDPRHKRYSLLATISTGLQTKSTNCLSLSSLVLVFFISSFFSLFYSLSFNYWTLNRFNIFFPLLQLRQCLFWTFFLFLSFIRVESGTKKILIKKICWSISIYLINGHSQSIGDELESPWS